MKEERESLFLALNEVKTLRYVNAKPYTTVVEKEEMVEKVLPQEREICVLRTEIGVLQKIVEDLNVLR